MKDRVVLFSYPCGWISGGGYTYYWSGRPHGHLEEVAVAVADRLVPMITEVTPVNERIMRLRISHTFRPEFWSGRNLKEWLWPSPTDWSL